MLLVAEQLLPLLRPLQIWRSSGSISAPSLLMRLCIESCLTTSSTINANRRSLAQPQDPAQMQQHKQRGQTRTALSSTSRCSQFARHSASEATRRGTVNGSTILNTEHSDDGAQGSTITRDVRSRMLERVHQRCLNREAIIADSPSAHSADLRLGVELRHMT